MNRKDRFRAFADGFFRLRSRFPFLFFVTGRIFSMIFILFLLGFAVFALMELTPGDVVENYVKARMMNSGAHDTAVNLFTPESIAAMKHELGLDQPFYVQYFRWLKQVFIDHDLGRSLISRAEILPLTVDRMVNSLVLNLISLVFLTVISFAIGIALSAKVGTPLDAGAAVFGLFFHSFPSILMMILLQVFAAVSGWFPIRAYPSTGSFVEAPLTFSFDYLYHIVLPLTAAFLGGIGSTVRTVRATMLDQLGQPYIKALRARGVCERRIYFVHAFRNTMNPYITSSSNLLASLFSGSLILEIVFGYPGIGRLMYEAILQQDVNLVLTNIMFVGFLVLLGMILSDILLAVTDPRIKYGGGKLE